MRSGLKDFIFPLFLFVIIWEIAALTTGSNSVPSPISIMLRIGELSISNNILQINIYHSMYRYIFGCSIALICGTSLGIMMGLNQVIYKTFKPLVSLFISLPTLAWVPLLLVFVGIGDTTIMIAIFLGAFFPLVYNTLNGIQSVNTDMVLAARTMGAGRYQIFMNVILPGSLVSILTGFRLAIGNSWRALVGAEMLAATNYGLGYMIYSARAFYDIESMFAGLVMIALLSFTLDTALIKMIENRTIRKWGLLRSD